MAKKQRRPVADVGVQEIPIAHVFRQYDRVAQIMSVMNEHDFGAFSRSAGLVDEALTDDRIAGVTEQRVAAIKAAPFTVEPSGKRKVEALRAAEVGGLDKQAGLWPRIVSDAVLGELLSWGWWLGFAYAKINWLREPGWWLPTLSVWHPQWVRWDWTRRVFTVQTERGEQILPRPDLQPRGDGKWFVWCPYGVQYGWTRAVIRSMALKYVSRQWNERDWDRHNERQGMAVMKMKVPAAADERDKAAVFGQLNNLGSEASVMLPQSKEGPGYDLDAMEFVARTWEAMKDRKGVLDVDIAVRILGQNLSTEVQGGSFAAAQTHNLVRLDRAIADAKIGPALREQVLSWWAEFNFGDPELAPRPTFHVAPPDDEAGEGVAMKAIGDGITSLRAAEPRLNVAAIVEEHGFPLLSDEEMAQRAAAAGGGPGAALTPTAVSAIIKVNEARALIGLGPLLTPNGSLDPDGEMTVAEFQAEHADTVAGAVNAEAGDGGGEDGAEEGAQPAKEASAGEDAAAGEGDAAAEEEPAEEEPQP